MNLKEITTSVIAIAIVLGAIASLFFTVQAGAEETIRVLAGAVIGYYFGSKSLPLGGALKWGSKKK